MSVIRQNGESQNGCFKKTKHAKFSGKQTFLSPWVMMIIQKVLTLTKFVLYVCWMNKMPPSFLLNQWNDVRRRKNMKNPVNVLPMVQGKPLYIYRIFNQVLAKTSWAKKLKFSSTILQ